MTFVFALINLLLLCIGCAMLLGRCIADLGRPLKLITGCIIALVLVSWCYYLLLVIGIPLWGLLIVLTLANAAHIYWGRSLQILSVGNFYIARPKQTLILLVSLFSIVLYFIFFQSKHGDWDAWSIWNLHAKFMADPRHWRNMFAPELNYSHRDYPLMLPSVVGYLWNSLGNCTANVPLLFALLVAFSIPVATYFSLAADHDKRTYACLAVLLFAVDSNFKLIASYQGADTLLSLFILLSVAYLLRQVSASGNQIGIAAFMAASGTWVKNEGWLFFVVFTLAFLIRNYRSAGLIKKYAIGAALPLIVSLSFKLFYAPANDLVAAGGKSLLTYIKDPARYIAIIKFILVALTGRYILLTAVLMTALILCRRYFVSSTFMILALVFMGYMVVYLTTPYGLDWHLTTSFDRVLQHLCPSLIFSMLYYVAEKYPLKEKRDG
ncbi:hypothetical protein [Mucilaginibacter myungsuensis]|uniref:Dolichyl-phosphate-mannose-protein mannosyltransferase n=1 Tax=Mucilaginibacter myungsuensis TaxID=649104 RepID=A0A929PZ07_9SPHI|nr:hypothetical protein [Mucilaginibacter myungsuensis]MBE9664010.1 hypothetical protein [Mucilaginibacter myungsuensis]MDN3601189.1 hypothetical protein [Mucilaginibacter myungsuensis]